MMIAIEKTAMPASIDLVAPSEGTSSDAEAMPAEIKTGINMTVRPKDSSAIPGPDLISQGVPLYFLALAALLMGIL